MTAHPKPKARKREPVRVYPDGREVCDLTTAGGKGIYALRTMKMSTRQGHICPLCESRMFRAPTFDHEAGRGHGGAHRDDRLEEVDGSWKNAAVCYPCNIEKGSKRYHWKDGKYVPVEK